MMTLPGGAKLTLTEVDINNSTGQVTVKGSVNLTVPPAGGWLAEPVFDSTLPGWRLAYVTTTE